MNLFQLDKTLKSHYYLLYMLGVYIKEVKSSKIVLFPSEDSTIGKLDEFELHLYQLMCSLQSTILATGSDVINEMNRDILHTDFKKGLSRSLYRIYLSLYITMQDSINLMDFLNTIYKYMGRRM